jgi:hypothetical protein
MSTAELAIICCAAILVVLAPLAWALIANLKDRKK